MKITFVERDTEPHGPTCVAAFESVVVVDGEPIGFYSEENLRLAKDNFLNAVEWCEENFGDHWYDTKPEDETIFFYTMREAAAFKIRWG